MGPYKSRPVRDINTHKQTLFSCYCKVWSICLSKSFTRQGNMVHETGMDMVYITYFRLNKLSPHYILEELNFNLRYVRQSDLDIPKTND